MRNALWLATLVSNSFYITIKMKSWVTKVTPKFWKWVGWLWPPKVKDPSLKEYVGNMINHIISTINNWLKLIHKIYCIYQCLPEQHFELHLFDRISCPLKLLDFLTNILFKFSNYELDILSNSAFHKLSKDFINRDKINGVANDFMKK